MSGNGRRRKVPRKTTMSGVRSDNPETYAALQVADVPRATRNSNEQDHSGDSEEEQRQATIRDFRMLWEDDFNNAFPTLAQGHLDTQVSSFSSSLQTFPALVTDHDSMRRQLDLLTSRVEFLEAAVRSLESRLANVPARNLVVNVHNPDRNS